MTARPDVVLETVKAARKEKGQCCQAKIRVTLGQCFRNDLAGPTGFGDM